MLRNAGSILFQPFNTIFKGLPHNIDTGTKTHQLQTQSDDKKTLWCSQLIYSTMTRLLTLYYSPRSLSRPSRNWLRPRSRTDHCHSGSVSELATPSVTMPREDTGEELNWTSKRTKITFYVVYALHVWFWLISTQKTFLRYVFNLDTLKETHPGVLCIYYIPPKLHSYAIEDCRCRMRFWLWFAEVSS